MYLLFITERGFAMIKTLFTIMVLIFIIMVGIAYSSSSNPSIVDFLSPWGSVGSTFNSFALAFVFWVIKSAAGSAKEQARAFHCRLEELQKLHYELMARVTKIEARQEIVVDRVLRGVKPPDERSE
jgi:cell shape-determining protein MreC